MKLIIINREDSVASLVIAIDTESNEESDCFTVVCRNHGSVPRQASYLCFGTRMGCTSMPNGQPSWLETLCASLKSFFVVVFLAGL